MVALIYGWGPGSNWQEWDQLELGTCWFPGKGRKVLGGGQACIPVPCVQIPAAGSRAFPAGFSLSFSGQRF